METFGKRLRRLRKDAELTQEQLAHACGYSGQSRIANYESDSRLPSLKEIPAIASALGVQEAELVSVLPINSADDGNWPDVIGVRVAAALGEGVEPDEYAETHKLKFRAESLARKKLDPAKLAVVYGKGESMYPTIKDGDAILFDRRDTTPRKGKLYVVTYDRGLCAKRLNLLGGRWFLESDNQNDPKWHDPVLIDEVKGFEIHGRVRWIGSWED